MAAPLHALICLFALLGAGALAGCGERDKATAAADVRRPPVRLQFDGHVYLPPSTSDFKILERVRAETRSVFTGLRKHRVMVSRREVEVPDPDDFKKEAVTVVDTATGERNLALRVRYRYVARTEIAHALEDRQELDLALLHREDEGVTERVLRECTANTAREQEFASAIGIVFDPTLPSCKAAVAAEQAEIYAARAKLPEIAGAEAGTVVPVEEVRRLYIPIRVKLERRERHPGEVAPRYVPVDEEEEPVAQPMEPLKVGDAREQGVEREPEELAPATVIVDPDLAAKPTAPQELSPEAALLPPTLGRGGTPGARNVPQVVAPATAQAQRRAEPADEKFEIPLETLADPKFLVVWLSVLMAYPILRGERKG